MKCTKGSTRKIENGLYDEEAYNLQRSQKYYSGDQKEGGREWRQMRNA
jgi:hypothetical protein